MIYDIHCSFMPTQATHSSIKRRLLYKTSNIVT